MKHNRVKIRLKCLNVQNQKCSWKSNGSRSHSGQIWVNTFNWDLIFDEHKTTMPLISRQHWERASIIVIKGQILIILEVNENYQRVFLHICSFSVGRLEAVRHQIQEVLFRQVHLWQSSSICYWERGVLSIEAVEVLTTRGNARFTLDQCLQSADVLVVGDLFKAQWNLASFHSWRVNETFQANYFDLVNLLFTDMCVDILKDLTKYERSKWTLDLKDCPNDSG